MTTETTETQIEESKESINVEKKEVRNLEKWGEVDWTFNQTTGQLILDGTKSEGNLLGEAESSPWNIGAIEKADLKKIVIVSNLKMPKDSGYLFASLDLNEGLKNFKEIKGLEKLDTRDVEEMSYMFSNTEIKSLDFTNWQTSNVKKMQGMFSESRIQKINLAALDTSNVEEMANMFGEATELREITLGEKTLLNKEVNLNDPEKEKDYTGKWQEVGTGSVDEPNGEWVGSSAELIQKTQMPRSQGESTYVRETDQGTIKILKYPKSYQFKKGRKEGEVFVVPEIGKKEDYITVKDTRKDKKPWTLNLTLKSLSPKSNSTKKINTAELSFETKLISFNEQGVMVEETSIPEKVSGIRSKVKIGLDGIKYPIVGVKIPSSNSDEYGLLVSNLALHIPTKEVTKASEEYQTELVWSVNIDKDVVIPSFDPIMNIKDSTIYNTDTWQVGDNLVDFKDEFGKKLPQSEIKTVVNGDLTKPGKHEVTYTYKNVSKKGMVNVKEDKSSLVLKESLNHYTLEPAWQTRDSFVSATNREGTALSWNSKELEVIKPAGMTNVGTHQVTLKLVDPVTKKSYQQKKSTIVLREGINRTGWLSRVPDTMRLSEVSMPGTHDTMAYKQRDSLAPSTTWKTQDKDLMTQLNLGVRYLDLRVAHDLSMHHGIVDLGTYFDLDVLPTIRKFLKENPEEFILARVKHEDGSEADYDKNIAKVIADNRDLFAPYQGSLDPEISGLRGKIAVLDNGDIFSRNQAAVGTFWDTRTTRVQDNYDNPTYDNKYKYIKNFLNESNIVTNKYFYLNHVSAAGDWTAAIGGRNPKKYADNLNPKVRNDLLNTSMLRSGVMIFDYIGQEEIDATVSITYRYLSKYY